MVKAWVAVREAVLERIRSKKRAVVRERKEGAGGLDLHPAEALGACRL